MNIADTLPQNKSLGRIRQNEVITGSGSTVYEEFCVRDFYVWAGDVRPAPLDFGKGVLHVEHRFEFTPTFQMSSDVDEYLKAITQCKGVDKIIIMGNDGFPIKTTIVGEDISTYTQTFWHLAKKAQQLVKQIDYSDCARLVRFRSKKNETLMAIDPEASYVMIIIQTPKVE